MSNYRGPKASLSHGKAVHDVEGLFHHQSRRVAPGLFSDVDRAYRAKFLKAQQMTARDQATHLFYLWDNPDFRKARLNPLRRIWQAPVEAFERSLRPMLGLGGAFTARFMLTKSLWALAAGWYIAYYMKYRSSDWTRQGGFKTMYSKPMTPPTNPNFPNPDPNWERHEAADYWNNGFKQDKTGLELKPSIPVTW